MTWQELADFINEKMPKCNRNQLVNIWDAKVDGETGGKFCDAKGISPFDADSEPSEDNFYSIDIDADDWSW